MKIEIHSRESIEELINGNFPENAAVISFYNIGDEPVNYKGKAARLFQIAINDIDMSDMSEYDLTCETFLPEAPALADFIVAAVEDNMGIICQCDYGEGRSAGCAAAILEFYEHRGIKIFADYKYYPNKLIYHSILNALIAIKNPR